MTKLQQLEHYASEGVIEGHFQLGMIYETGKEVPRDEVKGIVLIQKAAEQGAAFASSTLSAIYIGKGDVTNGIYWLQKAAEQGLSNSQGQLGLFYSMDKIAPKDLVKACAWLAVASANGCPGNPEEQLEKIRN